MQNGRKLNVPAHMQQHFEDAAQGGKAGETAHGGVAIWLRVSERPTSLALQCISSPPHVKTADLESAKFQVCLAQLLA